MRELEELSMQDTMSMSNLEAIDKLSHSIKNLCKIIEDNEMGGYSMDDGYSMRRGYSRGYSNDDMRHRQMDLSYADNSYGMMPYSYDDRGRGSQANRDSMGRYSSRGYSRNGMVDNIRNLMAEAPDERTRQELQRIMDRMETM